MTTITRDMIEARLLLPVLNFSLACISEQKGTIADAKTALVDEVERLVRDGQASYRTKGGVQRRAKPRLAVPGPPGG